MGLSMVDALASLGGVDAGALGLGDFGQPQGFLRRQPQRWSDELQGYLELDGYAPIQLPDVQPVAEWLEGRIPPPSTPGLMHGDFHLANVMFSNTGPEVAAIVDWEMCTLGDPLVDLAWMLVTWPDPASHNILPIQPADGFPSAAELIERYASRSPRSLDHLLWYQVFAAYKLGIVLEGTHARACAGKAPKSTGDVLHRCAVQLIHRARALIERA
jgi:aminoglycoside phosphotransferase (APT) family kinase protein